MVAAHQSAALGVGTLDRRHVGRGRKEVDDRVEDRLHAPVAQRGAAQHRHDVAGYRPAAQGRADLSLGRLLLLEVHVHDRVVVVRRRLDQVVAVLLDELLHACRHGLRLDAVGAEVVRVHDRVLGDQVEVALEVALSADGQLNRHRSRAQARADGVQRAVEVGSDAVHLVDEGDPGHAVAVGLAPDRLGLRLHARDGVEHGHGAVEHAQAALDLDREVHVSGCVYDVDRVLAPLRSRRSRRDRDPPLLLLDHPVHGGGPFVNLSHLVDAARIEKDAFGGRRFTGVNVRHDPDVPGLLDRDRTLRHFQCHAHLS